MSAATTSAIEQNRIVEAKARFTIPVLWRMFNLKGEPARCCRSPFREDRNPSFSVSEDGLVFHDFATGQGGDAIDFLALIRGISIAGAFVELLEMAGTSAADGKNGGREFPRAGEQSEVQTRPRPELSGLELCSEDDLERISVLRSIPIAGLTLARERRLLFACEDLFQGRLWVITDDARRSAIKRKLDGQPFIDRDPETGRENQKKSKCWMGSQANWPIGIANAGAFAAIALCEGGPDFLAAFYLAWAGAVETLVAPVCMGGAALSIHPDALGMFRGKRVRIFGHVDQAGQQAVHKWAAQLRSVQAEVDAFDFSGLVAGDGKPVGDLNDFVLADHKKSGCGIEITTGAFDFALERRASS
jgi:hypothetical protein